MRYSDPITREKLKREGLQEMQKESTPEQENELIIEDNTVYEIDMECIRRKRSR